MTAMNRIILKAEEPQEPATVETKIEYSRNEDSSMVPLF